jgi:uncharacterized alpha/beta hydrolase family protein
MKKLIISLAGIIMLTGVFLIVSANNALRITSNNVDIPQNQDNKNNKNILLLGYWGEF